MDGVFEHVVSEIRRWFHEVIQHLEDFYVLLLLLCESVERHIVRVDFHTVHRLSKVLPVLDYLLFAFFYFLFLVREPLQLFVNLLLHHRVEILLLNF